MNDNHSNKILESLYNRGKTNSKGNTFKSLDYDVREILSVAGVSEEAAKPFLKILGSLVVRMVSPIYGGRISKRMRRK